MFQKVRQQLDDNSIPILFVAALAMSRIQFPPAKPSQHNVRPSCDDKSLKRQVPLCIADNSIDNVNGMNDAAGQCRNFAF